MPAPSRRTTLVLLVVYVAAGAALLLSPLPDAGSWAVWKVVETGHSLGLPMALLQFTRVEFVLNVLLLVPLAGLGHLLLPRVTWQQWTAYAFVASTTFECIQAIFFPERSATFSDIVANTAGGLIGAFLAQVIWKTPRR